MTISRIERIQNLLDSGNAYEIDAEDIQYLIDEMQVLKHAISSIQKHQRRIEE